MDHKMSALSSLIYICLLRNICRVIFTDTSSSTSLSVQVDRAAEAFCAFRNLKRDLLT